MILGIAGKAGSGKDTVSDYLIKLGLMDRKQPFAKALKEYCGEMFDISEYDLYNNKGASTNVEVTRAMIEVIPELDSRLGTFLSVREVLQYFGTNFARRFYDSIWVDLALNSVKSDENVVISDVRFINEVKAIHKRGGKVIQLTRNPHHMNHASETQLDDYGGIDLVYNNEGETPEETCSAIAELIK